MTVMMGCIVFFAFSFMEGPERVHSSVGAERFVNYVCLGEEGDPQSAGDPEALCGYALAHDMLSDDLRESIPYAAFCEEFELIRERYGPVQRIEKAGYSRMRRFNLVRYAYDLWFGDTDAGPDELKVHRLIIELEWVDEGRWVVTNYRLAPLEQREVR